MKSNEYGGWRMIIFWFAVAAVAAIGGFSLGWSWRDVAPTRTAIDLALQVMIAFGTVGTAVAAVAVPLYQNWDRRREQRIAQLLTDWALSEEVHRISYRLRELGKALATSWALPSARELGDLQTQLRVAKQTTLDRMGGFLIGNLLGQVVALQEERDRRASIASSLRDAGVAREMPPPTDDAIRQIISSLEAFHEQTYHWMERVIRGFDAVGLQAPGVVKGSGKANIRMYASGDGRVERASDNAT
ncbi:hypothetical protein GCM10009108_04110 [Castellaniella ginsengisoli]|uniref:Uncharacterized protein n=1 Tax=Castellaniella ginsengisoli TaxID=546114 RepID=A0ABN1KQP7_9BURK